MMRAISSPSSSMMGVATLIFAISVNLASTGRLLQGRDHKGRCAQRQADRAISRNPPRQPFARAGSRGTTGY